ncbi:MAG: hypothetical protein NTU63_01340 [Candidatus Pacearchaeota archaeon]|nr:hypothetical protein [Candidatus Pacearchaeota archaeon]
MLVKLLGGIDLIGGLILIFGSNDGLPLPILIIFGIILLIKAGIGKLKDFASWIDIFAGIIFILLIFLPVYWVVCIIAGILLIQKGIFSLL